MRENVDYVVCQICRKQVKRLQSPGHLDLHNITLTEYKEMFPGTCTTIERSREFRKKMSLINRGRKRSKEF